MTVDILTVITNKVKGFQLSPKSLKLTKYFKS